MAKEEVVVADDEGPIPYLELRQQMIETCLQMNRMGINQGTSGNVSARVPGGQGFLVTASGIPYEQMGPEQVVYVDLEGGYYGEFLPSSEWRMHYDIYRNVPEALAVVHAHPTYGTALASQRRGIPAFHYMVAAVAGGKEIKCANYASVGTQELSDEMLAALGPRKSVLLANHGMICHGPTLEKALWVANETECLARQYVCAMSIGSAPVVLPDEEIDVMLAKFKTYGKKPSELQDLSDFERKHAISAPPRKDVVGLAGTGAGEVPFAEARRKVIETCLKMEAMGINQGTSGNASCRVPGGFVVTASGVPYDKMRPDQVVFMDLEGNFHGAFQPSSEWRMHYDIYKSVPQAEAVVHAHPTYCTALSSQRRHIPGFHSMVAVAGARTIPCADYATFGTQELSDSLLAALGESSKSALLANHGMICYGPDLDKALWLANETECLAKQYICALSTGLEPVVLPDAEMDVMLAKIKTYGKRPREMEKLSDFERKHAVKTPRFAGPMICGCCASPSS
mmetsp:Transcript_40254/g.129341  ORF Transcript_40254/g.129341 Transcript_40254/m.129341 type:complete len:512 (+) Transcript_40254:58-1593(+)